MLGDRTSTRSWHCNSETDETGKLRGNFNVSTIAKDFEQLRGAAAVPRDPELSVEFYKAFLLAPQKKKKKKAEKQPAAGTRGSEGGKRPPAQKTVRAARPGFLNNQKKKIEKPLESLRLDTKKRKTKVRPTFSLQIPRRARVPPHPTAPPETLQTSRRARAARLTGDYLFLLLFLLRQGI